MDAQAEGVLAYWRQVGPAGWYAGGEALDDQIRGRFADLWAQARAGGLTQWMGSAEGLLAYLMVTDQFPRNMFRGSAQAFASDAQARVAAARAWQHGFDLRIEGPIRQFFYLPLMHSETQTDQDRCVALFAARLPGENLLHARAHREVIRRFGRFPYRNAALGRVDSPEEQVFLAQGGYAAILRSLGG